MADPLVAFKVFQFLSVQLKRGEKKSFNVDVVSVSIPLGSIKAVAQSVS